VLESVDVGKRAVADYKATAGREAVERLRELAEPLRGARVLHLNATPYGGVAETLWKGTPMVAGEAGGIPMQMPAGAGGFLVGSVEECAEKLLFLLRNPDEGARLARSGKEAVRQRFLLPHLISDELDPDGRPADPNDLAHVAKGNVPVRIRGLTEASRT
jgi:hypothetical protein